MQSFTRHHFRFISEYALPRRNLLQQTVNSTLCVLLSGGTGMKSRAACRSPGPTYELCWGDGWLATLETTFSIAY
ncbi:hypothetical protein PC120_g18778 [Phytophthora cactorum]|nr:hypothetical protein PC120_g18778 [Phytophthora cactorum]